ncbi:MAG: NAD(P)-binding domain-containing protein, partial [Lachnospiraceae bacterium]|nr:NAD(P)-binding domain-containing protein [Lachnospiraceae bacterium]
MRITIVGGGNIGTQFAAHCAEKNHEVTVFTSKPNMFSRSLKTVNEINVVEHQGIIKKATSDPKEAFKNAECVMVTVPAALMDQIANIVYDNAPSNALIGLIPGTGGGECSFSKCIDRGNIVFGLERVPSVARLVKYGETVRAVGYRDCLRVASLPAKHAEKCSSLMSLIFDMPCLTIPNYLNITMTPSNPLLHTTRLR